MEKRETKIQNKNNISLFGVSRDENNTIFKKIIKFEPVISITSTLLLLTLDPLNKKNEKKLNPRKIITKKIKFNSSIILI